MKKQVVVIHGGNTFPTYGQYLKSLKTKEVTKDTFQVRKDWKSALGQKLGANYEILAPRMPNGFNAQYQEWKIWFERLIPFLDNNVILVGHSLGGIFLAKYLAQHTFKKKVKALILIASPYKDPHLKSFALPQSLRKLSKQVSTVYILHSKDDPVVEFEQMARYQAALPGAHAMIFKNKKHFNQEQFPEIVKLIKSL